MESENDDLLDGALQLDSSESDVEDGSASRPRRPWTTIWRSTEPDALERYRSALPPHSIDKSNPVGCTINHLIDQDYDLHRCGHKMRSQLALCKSERCKSRLQLAADTDTDTPLNANRTCPCRYKFKVCLSSSTCEVLQQGNHAMGTDDPPTPVKSKLTLQMKDYITDSLGAGEQTTASRLHSLICTLVDQNNFDGPAPTSSQVSDFVKNWRRKNPKDSMAPMIELCDGHLYDQIDIETTSDTAMIILCDSQRDTGPGAEGTVSHLGDGSVAYPLRVGMTCLRLIRSYLAVQTHPDFTTILHIDSTHSMVINGYLVFVFGFSDRAGHFFPLVYFCTSQKRAIDIGWCIRYLKRVCMDCAGVQFAPQFVMMDADKAQFNACVTELPHTVVLMCWFHVTKNVWKHSREKRVSEGDTRSVFVDLYDMHYASEQEYPVVKTQILTKWSAKPRGSPVRKLTDHIAKMWVKSHRFMRWQAHHTPPVYAATNNPLEQYHRKVKLQCPDGPSIPSELIQNLNGARLAFMSSDPEFSSVPTASERLVRLYRFMCKRECLVVHILPPVGSVAADLYRVEQRPLRLAASEKKLVARSIRSVNSRRKQTEGMPAGGWVVDTRSKSCSCAYNRKHAMCCHVISACVQGGVSCSGVSMRFRQFVRPSHVHAQTQEGSPDSDTDFLSQVSGASTPRSTGILEWAIQVKIHLLIQTIQ